MKCRFTTQRDFPKYMKRKMNTTNKTYETAGEGGGCGDYKPN